MASNSRKQLEGWLKTIDVNGKVLDIGGSQNPIKGRTKSWDVKEYTILDLENPHEEKNKPNLKFDINNDTIDDPLEAGEYLNEYDVAFCLEVSEYLWNPATGIYSIRNFLKDNGLLYISFHTLYGLHNPKGEDCLRYTKNAIVKLMKESGFEIQELKARTLTNEGRSLYYQFCRAEGMRLDYQDPETYHAGYLVKAKKI